MTAYIAGAMLYFIVTRVVVYTLHSMSRLHGNRDLKPALSAKRSRINMAGKNLHKFVKICSDKRPICVAVGFGL